MTWLEQYLSEVYTQLHFNGETYEVKVIWSEDNEPHQTGEYADLTDAIKAIKEMYEGTSGDLKGSI